MAKAVSNVLKSLSGLSDDAAKGISKLGKNQADDVAKAISTLAKGSGALDDEARALMNTIKGTNLSNDIKNEITEYIGHTRGANKRAADAVADAAAAERTALKEASHQRRFEAYTDRLADERIALANNPNSAKNRVYIDEAGNKKLRPASYDDTTSLTRGTQREHARSKADYDAQIAEQNRNARYEEYKNQKNQQRITDQASELDQQRQASRHNGSRTKEEWDAQVKADAAAKTKAENREARLERRRVAREARETEANVTDAQARIDSDRIENLRRQADENTLTHRTLEGGKSAGDALYQNTLGRGRAHQRMNAYNSGVTNPNAIIGSTGEYIRMERAAIKSGREAGINLQRGTDDLNAAIEDSILSNRIAKTRTLEKAGVDIEEHLGLAWDWMKANPIPATGIGLAGVYTINNLLDDD